MRATFAGLNTMVRGIMSNQLSLDTTGHNITNAGTEGYTRQQVTLATTQSEQRAGLHGMVTVGTGVDVSAVERARNIYADIQYRNENPTQQYFQTMAINYDKLETIFDDSKNLGIEKALGNFYSAWVDLSTTTSTAAARVNVIEQGRQLSDVLQSKTSELQDQINSEYEDLKSEIKHVDDILENIVAFNKQLVTQEVGGGTANDLRDKLDLLVDELSNYMNINVTQNSFGAYQINSGGVTLVNGPSRAHLVMSDGLSSSFYGIDYGVTDYNITVKESNLVFIPQNGILKARLDSIDECKSYIDKIADIASFMLTSFNEQHKQGWDSNGNYKFVDENGDTVDNVDEATLTAVNFLKADSTAVDTADEKNITLKDGKYYLNDEEVTRLDADVKYLTSDDKLITKTPDSINFFGKENINYEYRYDEVNKKNYLYRYDDDVADSEKLLSGVRIIQALEVNAKFEEWHGDYYVASATSRQYVEKQDSNGNITGTWEPMPWANRTADGTNAVYLSELFNITHQTILSDNKANALVADKLILRDLDGNAILDDNGQTQHATPLNKNSINAFYQKSMSKLGIDAYSTDVNNNAMDAVMTQVNNWRDSTAGVDWNEELTNMIRFQKGFASCSRCLNAMDECLERLINTGVVGR